MRLVGLQKLGGRQHAVRETATGERAGNDVPAASSPTEGEPTTAFELAIKRLDGAPSRRLAIEVEPPFGLARRRAMREREREAVPAVRERVRVGDSRQQRVARARRSREDLPGETLVNAVAAEREEPAVVAPERARHHPRLAFVRQTREAVPAFKREVVRGRDVAPRRVAEGEVARLRAARRHQRRASVAQLADMRHVAHEEVVRGRHGAPPVRTPLLVASELPLRHRPRKQRRRGKNNTYDYRKRSLHLWFLFFQLPRFTPPADKQWRHVQRQVCNSLAAADVSI